MDHEAGSTIVDVGNIIALIGLFSLTGITIYYMGKTSGKTKLTQAEFGKAIALFAITSFIAGAGIIPVALATIDESTPIILQWFLSALISVSCLVIWPLFMVGGFIKEMKRANKVKRDR